MAEVGSAYVSILPSARGFGSKLSSEVGGEVDGAGKSIGSKFGTAFKVGAVAVLAGAAVLGKFLKGSIDEAREAQVVTARTENVIKKMGNAAGISAGQVAKLAGSISAKTGVDDEAIQSGQNLLLTFGHIRNEAGKGNDIFNQTSQLMVDMSAAMGTDAKGSAIQLGKALNDPIKGITALTRVGVSFSEGQKAQIERMVESGNTLGAQKVILAELTKQFGGAAEAMATPADKAKVAYANLKEQIGTALLPVVDKVLNAFVAAAPKISSAISGIGPLFGRIKDFVAPVIAQIQGFFGSGGSGGSALASFGATIKTTVLPALQQFGAFFTASILPVVMQFIAAIKANFLPVLQTMSTTFTGTVLPAITSLATYLAGKLFPVFTQIASIITGQVLPILASLATFFYGTIYPAVVKVATAVAQNLRPVFDALVAVVQGSVLPAIQKLLVKFREWQPTIQKVIGVVVQIIGKVLEFAAAILGKVLPPVIKFAGFLIGNVVPAVANVIGIVVKVIAKVIEFGAAVVDRVKDFVKFVGGLKDKFGEALDYVQGIPGKIKAALGAVATLLYSAGQDVIRGLINGIKNMASAAANAAKDAVKGAIDGAKSVLGINSPSRVFHEIGDQTIQGFVEGIEGAKLKALKAAVDALKSVREGIRGELDQIRSDFHSLSDTIAGAFTDNLFEASTASDFVANLLDTKGQLKKLKAAFKKLLGWGLKPNFLAQLFQSGNGGLILDLAASSRADAREAASLFGDVQSLSSSLGNAVAQEKLGPKIDQLVREQREATRAIKQVGRDVARALDHAAAKAQRSAA